MRQQTALRRVRHSGCIVSLLLCAAALIAGPAAGQTTSTGSGQAYPLKTVRIVTAEPGGGNDLAARLVAPGLSGSLGQQVIVENRGGASGTIAADTVAKSAPDGYTLLLYSSAVWILPLLQNVPYDPLRDFAPITLAASAPNILVVHPSLPVRSVRELLALAKARPGELNYASGATGSSGHLSGELLKSMAGINMVRIPYKGTGPGITALIGGEVQLMFPAAGGVTSYVKSGRLKAIAVTSAKQTALAPGVPTIAASGLPGFDSVSTYGFFAPAKTPAPVIARLNQEILRALAVQEVKDQLLKAGMETVGSSPEEFSAAMKSEMTRMGKVIRDAGIREN